MRGNADDWHHIGVMVVGNTGAIGSSTAVVKTLVARLLLLQMAVIVDTRVDDDVAQFALVVALFNDAAAVVVHVVTTITIVVGDYGRRELLRRCRCWFIASLETSGHRYEQWLRRR